jgi:hypothetical protein
MKELTSSTMEIRASASSLSAGAEARKAYERPQRQFSCQVRDTEMEARPSFQQLALVVDLFEGGNALLLTLLDQISTIPTSRRKLLFTLPRNTQ